jgi:hypothetical protein
MERAMDGFDFDDDHDEDDDDLWHDCGLGADGQCSKAGSEECDFECPHSHGEFYAGSNLWHKKHNAALPVEGCECTECRKARAA